MLQTYFHKKELSYLGPELRPHFIISQFRIEGSTLAAFIGPCSVKTDHLVDWEDRLANDHIQAKQMVHFLGEFFGITLKEGVWIQRLLVSEILSVLLKKGIDAKRSGDDLYIQGNRKLSVSIVTASPVSVLLHLGINVDPAGAPVQAIGLAELKIDAAEFAKSILEFFKIEYTSVDRACTKVRPVI
jgi:hypothetical protein